MPGSFYRMNLWNLQLETNKFFFTLEVILLIMTQNNARLSFLK